METKNNSVTNNSVIIVCAGSGTRSGLPFNKIFYPLGKKTVLDTVIDAFIPFGRIILVASPDDLERLKLLYPDCTVVLGGETRTDSVRRGLKAAAGSRLVAVHDAARPFVTFEVIERAFDSAEIYGSGIAAVKSTDAICIASDDNINADDIAISKINSPRTIAQSLKKERLYCLQTPQCFRCDELADAYDRLTGSCADDSEAYALAGYTPRLTEGDYKNKKLTTPRDFTDFTPLSALGSGFDVHPLAEGRRLILGGIEIPHEKGLLGHSDADVLAHAVTDAILSAAGQPDIGVLFPDSDGRYKNADSMLFLADALARLESSGKKITSLSCVLIAQRPRLSPFIPAIKQNLSAALKIDAERVNVSATTTEFLGIVGEGKAIAASAALLCSCK